MGLMDNFIINNKESKMRNKIAQEHREAYEHKVKECCDVCNQSIEQARQTFLETKRSARKTRDEAITKLRQGY